MKVQRIWTYVAGGIAVVTSAVTALVLSRSVGDTAIASVAAGFLVLLGTRLLIVARDNQSLMRTLHTSSLALGQSEDRFRELITNSSDIITVLDESSVVRYITPAVVRLLGISAEEVVGKPLVEFLHPDDADLFASNLHDFAAGHGSSASLQFRIRDRFLAWRTLEATPTNLLDRPSVQGVVLNTRDITERQALENELRHQAFHDPLTNLANRALLQDRLEQAVRRQARTHDVLALILIDLDDFKNINDSLGHAEGDAMLRAAADRMVKCLRETDTAARLGGDEFAILLEGSRESLPAADIAQRIIRGLAQPLRIGGQVVTMHASLGVAMADEPCTATDLLRRADVAMYRAKALGKGRCVIFDTSMEQVAHDRLNFQTDMARALENRELALHYQPVVNLKSGVIDGVEALVRWHHPERGLVMPNDFIPAAESSGFIIPMSLYVLHEACAQTLVWKAKFPTQRITVSVNISALHLQSPTFVEDILREVRQSQIPPDLLILELTETAVLADVESSVAKLNRVKKLGVSVALDDFGTGYSSLGYLRELPIDIVKIDRSFLAHVGEQREHTELVRAIQTLSASLDLITTAEGVETQAQLAVLRAMGVDHAQGYLFSRPVEATAVEKLFSEGPFNVGEGPVIARIASGE